MKITKIFTFDSSHMLDGHDGKCQNLHGHTYKLEITVSDDPVRGGPKDGMVMDFTDLKAIVKQHITDPSTTPSSTTAATGANLKSPHSWKAGT